MIIRDAPIGTKLCVGTFEDVDLKWVKISDEQDFVTECPVFRGVFDNPEYQNNSRARRNHGNNFFPQSNVFQFMNATEEDWFKKTHEYDESPAYAFRPGFLYGFTPGERSMLVDREITVAVPLGSRKEFGKTQQITCKVCLPSASELGYIDDTLECEGAKNPELFKVLDQFRHPQLIMTRTGVVDAGHILSLYAMNHRCTFESTWANQNTYLMPMIRLDPNATISDDTDDYGYHRLSFVDHEFIDRFMSMIQF